MIELSIIIPVYNVEKYLRQCLDSVLRESPGSSEIILIDDGSTDASPAICDEYMEIDSRIRVIHQKNRGLSGARNVGIENALGEFLFFLDSDDYLEEGYFEKMLSKKADLVIGSFVAFYSNHLPDFYISLESKQYDDLHSYLTDFYLYFPTIFNFAWGKIYRKSIIQENRLYFKEELHMVEDVLFNLEYYHCCEKIILVYDAVVRYRQGDGTLSKKYNERLFQWYLLSYEAIKELLESEFVFMARNQSHFYEKLLGNVFECLEGAIIAKSPNYNQLCCDVFNSNLVKQALGYNQHSRMLGVIYSIRKKNMTFLKINFKLLLLCSTLMRRLRGLKRR